jgi:Skp family chaperone for outer membrane proteins
MGLVRSAILILDVERLVDETLFGQRIATELDASLDALEAENQRSATEMTARERSLTERRPSMDPEAFRAEADAFDAEVTRRRAEQDAKQQALATAAAEGRDAFLAAAAPVLTGLMAERGAAVILERRDVFLGASAVDVTDEAIVAIDAAIGSGVGAGEPAD